MDVGNWRPVAGYEGHYEVSDQGNVRSIDRVVINRDGVKRTLRGKMLRPGDGGTGHLIVSLNLNGVASSKKVHRLVLAAFVGPCPAGLVVCHNNGDPTDNRLSNLRYDTYSENLHDRVRHGVHHNTNKTRCPRGHLLESPNLVAYGARRGHRNCLACSRTRPYIRSHPELRDNLQIISDQYYAAIIAEKASAA